MGSIIGTAYLFLFRYDFRGYGFTPTALFIFLAKAVFFVVLLPWSSPGVPLVTFVVFGTSDEVSHQLHLQSVMN